MKTLLSRCLFFAPVLSLAAAHSTSAQTPAPASSFEVASVRLSNTDPVPFTADNEPLSGFPNNRFYARNLPLKLTLGIAFGVDQPSYIEGGP
ncbi:MAG TPA: hypothetical protein VII58_08735, partial [Acidobacteriaceae bacterium]